MATLPPGAVTALKLPKNPDRYPNMDFDPVQFSEYPKAVYVESPDLSGSSKVDGLDHLAHKMPVIVHSPEAEADIRHQDDEWKAREADRKAREDEQKSTGKSKG